jgi:SAM-dependent methyltransferase
MDELLEMTGRVEATHFWFRGFRLFTAPVIKDIANGRRDLRLLDCGCGTGKNMSSLLTPYGRSFGFDLTPRGVAYARASGHPIVRADITQIPYTDETFDVVTSFDVLPCIPDDGRAVKEMARVLKFGGWAVITVAALETLRGDHSETSRELRRYTRISVRHLVEDAGLTPTRIAFLFGSLFPLMFGQRLVQRLTRSFRSPQLAADLQLPLPPVNSALSCLVSAEAGLARYIPMPVGSSLLVVAQKPQTGHRDTEARRNQ